MNLRYYRNNQARKHMLLVYASLKLHTHSYNHFDSLTLYKMARKRTSSKERI